MKREIYFITIKIKKSLNSFRNFKKIINKYKIKILHLIKLLIVI